MTIFSGASRRTGQQVEQAVDLTTLTRAQLVELAKERGITVPRRATKAQIAELLKEV